MRAWIPTLAAHSSSQRHAAHQRAWCGTGLVSAMTPHTMHPCKQALGPSGPTPNAFYPL
jgi:hypothetical protein